MATMNYKKVDIKELEQFLQSRAIIIGFCGPRRSEEVAVWVQRPDGDYGKILLMKPDDFDVEGVEEGDFFTFSNPSRNEQGDLLMELTRLGPLRETFSFQSIERFYREVNTYFSQPKKD